MKSEREAESSYDIPYVQNLERHDTNEFTKQKQIHRLRMSLWLEVGKDGGRVS